MEITWLGHSAFRIRSGDIVIVTDPFADSVGFPLPQVKANIVTVSHPHPHHANSQAVQGSPRVLRGPGEYESAGVHILGLGSKLKPEAGPGPRNTIFIITLEGITLCHLGDLGEVPPARFGETLSRAQVLFIPAGGLCTITAAQAVEAIALVSPRIIIPMHYLTPGLAVQLNPLDSLLNEMGQRPPPSQPRLLVTRTNLPEEPRLVLLDPLR